MADPDAAPTPPEPDLFDRMVSSGQGAFALAMGSTVGARDAADLTDREKRLVDAAITAGVVGALDVMREMDDTRTP